VITNKYVVTNQHSQIIYVMAGSKKTNVGGEIDIVPYPNMIVAVIRWKELYSAIDCHIVTCFNQPWVFEINVIIKKHVLPATPQHKPKSEVPNKRRHQVQKTLHKMYDVSENLVEDPHAHLVSQQKILDFPHQYFHPLIT
jgi:hypothetical protein